MQYVSIITASYNYASFLPATIESVLSQTYPYWELIIVDDGSKDNSLDIIKNFVAHDNRIRLLQHADKKNHGLAKTVQLGICEARYDVITFLESDDMLLPESLAVRLELMKTHQANFVFNHCVSFSDQEMIMQEHIVYLDTIRNFIQKIKDRDGFETMFWQRQGNPIPTFSCVMLEKKLLQKCDFNPPHAPWLDFWLWGQIAFAINLAYSPLPLTKWRIHAQSFNFAHAGQNTSEIEYMLRMKLFKRLALNYPQKIPMMLASFYNWERFKQKLQILFAPFISRKLIKLSKLVFSICNSTNRHIFKHYLNGYINTVQQPCVQQPTNGTEQLSAKVDKTKLAHHPEPQFQASIRSILTMARTLRHRASLQQPVLLVVFHELSLTGAPMVGLELVRIMKKHYGIAPVVLALQGGVLQATLEEEGILVLVCEGFSSLDTNIELEEIFCLFFDGIIVNSLACAMFIRSFNNHALPIAWWIHETAEGFRYAPPDHIMQHCFSKMSAVWWGSPNSKPFGDRFVRDVHTAHLLYGVQDRAVSLTEIKKKSGLTFAVIGSLIPRKGQDVFIEALEKLSQSVYESAHFVIVGEPYEPDMWPDYTAKVLQKIQRLSRVEYIAKMANEEYIKLLASVDVLICPSTDDPMPVVVTDGLMLSKLCILSDAIGQAQFLEKSKEALFVHSGSAEALAKAITEVIEHPELIERFAKPARAAYERLFSMEQFEQNAVTLVDELLAKKTSVIESKPL